MARGYDFFMRCYNLLSRKTDLFLEGVVVPVYILPYYLHYRKSSIIQLAGSDSKQEIHLMYIGNLQRR